MGRDLNGIGIGMGREIGMELNVELGLEFQLDLGLELDLEFGLEYNKKVKITLIGKQILNSDPEGDFDQIVARLIFSYRF